MWRIFYGIVHVFEPLIVAGLRLHGALSRQTRVRVAFVNQYGEMLLIKNSIGSKKWTFPGGGVEKDETDEQAAVREIHEELQFSLDKSRLEALFVATPGEQFPKLRHQAAIYTVQCQKREIDLKKYNKLEIMDICWKKLDTMPVDTSTLVTTTVNKLL